MAIGITHKGKLVYAQGFGYADTSRQEKVTTRTNFHIASISKTFTTVALLRLVDQKRISLDDPIGKHLAWLRKANPKLAKTTVRQLASHTAGMLRDADSPHWASDLFPNRDELRDSMTRLPLLTKQRGDFKYSNFGFAVLGELISEVTGRSYDEHITELIKTIGMTGTSPDSDPQLQNPVATGYGWPVPHQDREVFAHPKTNAYAAATGFVSNIEDLGKYLCALTGKKLLAERLKKEITKKPEDIGTDKVRYGLGFKIWKRHGHQIIGHGGSFAGFSTCIALDQKNDIGVITLSNTIEAYAAEINAGIWGTIYRIAEMIRTNKGSSSSHSTDHRGIYRKRWGDLGIIDIGTDLIAFDLRNSLPLKSPVHLKYVRPNTYEIQSENKFDSNGEHVTFSKSGLLWGAAPYKKIQ